MVLSSISISILFRILHKYAKTTNDFKCTDSLNVQFQAAHQSLKAVTVNKPNGYSIYCMICSSGTVGVCLEESGYKELFTAYVACM